MIFYIFFTPAHNNMLRLCKRWIIIFNKLEVFVLNFQLYCTQLKMAVIICTTTLLCHIAVCLINIFKPNINFLAFVLLVFVLCNGENCLYMIHINILTVVSGSWPTLKLRKDSNAGNLT